MELKSKPVSSTELPCNENTIEEYKALSEECRFVMAKYMQGLVVYLALMAFGIKELISAKSIEQVIYIPFILTIYNALAFYAAKKFRSMAYHALNRKAILADILKFQRPHPMIWGYYIGILSILILQATIISIWFF